MTELEIAWLAGLLEGEGCFRVRKSGGYKGSVSISLQMTDEDVVKRVADLFGTKIWGPHGPYGASKLETWQTLIIGHEAAKLMEKLLPYLGRRRGEKVKTLLIHQKTLRDLSPNKNPVCHPEKKYFSKNMCTSCYMKDYHKRKKNAHIDT